MQNSLKDNEVASIFVDWQHSGRGPWPPIQLFTRAVLFHHEAGNQENSQYSLTEPVSSRIIRATLIGEVG